MHIEPQQDLFVWPAKLDSSAEAWQRIIQQQGQVGLHGCRILGWQCQQRPQVCCAWQAHAVAAASGLKQIAR